MKYNVGDRLILRRLNGRGVEADREVVAYKTGRKWGHAKPEGKSWPDIKFDLETGYEDGKGYSPSHRVLTAEQDAEEKRRSAVMDQLKALEVKFGFLSPKFSTEALEAVVKILASDQQGSAE